MQLVSHTNSLSEVTLKGAEKPCVASTPECPQLTGVPAASPAAIDHCQTNRWSRFIKRGLEPPNERGKKGITDCPMLAGEEENERHSATGRENPGACIVRWCWADSRLFRQLSQVTVRTAVISVAGRARTTLLCGLFVFTRTAPLCATSCCCSHPK